MNEALIIEARDRLKLQSIYLRDSKLSMHADFEPSTSGDHEIQLMIGLAMMKIEEIDDARLAADPDMVRSIRGEISAGVRLVGAATKPASEANEGPQGEVMAELTAKFRCEYLCSAKDTPSEAAIHEYLQHNAKMNVWPYWREFLQSTFARALLPQITLPLMVNKPMRKPVPPIAPPAEAISPT